MPEQTNAFDSILAGINGSSPAATPAATDTQDANLVALLDTASQLGELANWNVRAELENGLEVEVWYTNDAYRSYTVRNGVVTCDDDEAQLADHAADIGTAGDERDYAEEADNAELLANPDPGVDATSRIEQAQWAAANPSLCTGRGPTGRLRNFPAMRDEKLMVTLRSVEREGNDPEALDNLQAEAQHRGLI